MNLNSDTRRRAAPILVQGFVLNGYQIIKKLQCAIPIAYWYPEGFTRILIMVLEALLGVNSELKFHVESEETTLEITGRILDHLATFHKRPENAAIVQHPDLPEAIEIFVDNLVTEVSLYLQAEELPPAGCKFLRIYMDGGVLCGDLHVS